MIAFALLALGLGADSFRAGLALGVGTAWRRRVQLAIAFGLADAAASLLGLAIGRPLVAALGTPAQILGTTVLAVWGVWLLLAVTRARPAPPEEPAWLLFGLPVVLGLDNAVAIAAAGWIDVHPALMIAGLGASSAALALAGLALAATAAPRLPVPAAMLRGALFLAVAVVGLVAGD